MERIILKASEGAILTNGELYGTIVYLGTGDSNENWHEIPLDEYEQILKAKEEEKARNVLFE